MRRRNLLITLLVLISIWAYSARNADDVFAKESAVISVALPVQVESPDAITPEADETSVAPEPAVIDLSDTSAETNVADVPESIALVQPVQVDINEPHADKQWALGKSAGRRAGYRH